MVDRLPRILMIEDEDVVRLAIQISLDKDNYELEIAKSGGEGVERFRTFQPDLVLLDLKLPDIDGFSVLEKLDPEPGHIFSTVVLTGFVQPHFIERCFRMGVTSFLRKPVNTYELIANINNALTIVQCQKRLREQPTLEAKKVLVGANSATILLHAQNSLRASGFSVNTCSSWTEMSRMLPEASLVIVVPEFAVEDTDESVFPLIRKAKPDLPIYLYTAAASHRASEILKKFGGDGLILQMGDSAALISQVRRSLSERQSSNNL